MSSNKNKINKETTKPTYLNKKIAEYINNNPHNAFNHKQIAKALKLTDKTLIPFILSALEKLSETKQILKLEHGRYTSVQSQQTIEGVITINKKGPAILKTDNGQEYTISYTNLSHALPNDRVRAIVKTTNKKKTPKIEIVEIVKRARQLFVGVIEINKNFAYLIPDTNTLPVDIFIPKTEVKRTNVKQGQKIVVKITQWPDNSHNPIGMIEKVLGNQGDNDAEMHAILVEYGLPYEFEPNIEKAASQIDRGITPQEIDKRRDFRNVTTFTIDPADAKDFDDAISIKQLNDTTWEIGVHIADVTHYVEKGSPIDNQAFERGTSVYLVDRTVPMLPEKLSNDICSLTPNTEKLTYSAVFQIDNQANVIDYWLGRTIIKSKYRLSYDDAQKTIETREGELAEELAICNKIAQKLREQRFKNGAINFERSEVKFILDKNGAPIDVYLKENKEANQLIEEFMLLANRTVATHINTHLASPNKAKTFVYRIHDRPNSEKLERFAKFVRRFDLEIDTTDNLTISKSINNLVKNSNGKAWQNVVETLAVRSMARAEYSTDNIGHYGLAFKNYSHFTSPIRRYPDMMVHRLLTRYLENKRAATKPNLEAECKHCNEREILATSAERASIKYKQVEYLSDKIEQEFDGIISGVTSWGFYVELDGNSCEGMVPISSLDNDYYIFNEDDFSLVGEQTKQIYRLGDNVRIRVVKANLMKKQLDFELVKTYSGHNSVETTATNTKSKKREATDKKLKKTTNHKKSKSKKHGKKSKMK